MYKWDTNLETGNIEIDNQHKEWISYLNNLVKAFQEGKGTEEIIKTMNFLLQYTIKHFTAEEDLMLRHNYEDYLVHRRYHEEFKITARSLIRQLITEGPNEELVDKVIFTLRGWLLNHIRSDDFRMAACIKNREKPFVTKAKGY